jgi:hypothetical protein
MHLKSLIRGVNSAQGRNAADYLLGNDARFQYLRIIPSQMQQARRASSFQVMFLSWMTNSLCF